MKNVSSSHDRGTTDALHRRHEIVVVGASIAGAAAARALAAAGRDVLLLEQRRSPDARRLAGEMMHPEGARSLARLGVLPRLLEAGATRTRGFACWESPDAPRGEQLLDYESRDDGLPDHGVSLHHHELVSALQETATETEGVTLWHAKATGVERQGGRVRGVRVKGEDGSERVVECDLVVGADGRHSKVRRWLELESELEQPSMSIGVAVPASALPYPDRGHVFLGGWGPCLAYPVGREDARIVIDYPIGKWAGKDMTSELESSSLHVFPEPLRSAVSEGFRAGRHRFAANHHLVVPEAVVPGAVLIGDARGICHPLTAAGMTLSLHDAELLAEEVGGRGPIETAILQRFAWRREGFLWARVALCDGLYEIFRGESAETRTLRASVFERWRRSERTRRRTMALLACETSSPLAFFDQYLRVIGHALLEPTAPTRTSVMARRDLLRDSSRRLTRQLTQDARHWVTRLAPRGLPTF